MPVTFTDEFRHYVIEFGPAAALTLIAVILEEQAKGTNERRRAQDLFAQAGIVRDVSMRLDQ